VSEIQSVVAECTPCGATLELAREGTQTSTIKKLLEFLAHHRPCRQRGDVIIRSGDEK
jgi:hypothetical protein